jgi:hypothetical protein
MQRKCGGNAAEMRRKCGGGESSLIKVEQMIINKK